MQIKARRDSSADIVMLKRTEAAMERLQASDIMTRRVVTVRPDSSLTEVAVLLSENRISAVPVVDEQDAVIGIVSEGDLLHRPETGTESRPSWWLVLISDQKALAGAYIKSHGQTARDMMTTPVVSVAADTPVSTIATLLEQRRIKRVPVVSHGRLIGIVSRADLVRALAERLVAPAQPSGSDASIEKDLRRRLAEEPWAHDTYLNVSVQEGTVELCGWVTSPAERRALCLLAQGIPGARGVKDLLVERGLPRPGM